jgi:hypothetical protein
VAAPVPARCLALALKPDAFHGLLEVILRQLSNLPHRQEPPILPSLASRRPPQTFFYTSSMTTILLFLTRDAALTFDEFQHHYEHTHLPLAHTLLSDVWPTTFRRRYLARVNRKGFGGPANPDRPALTLRGQVSDIDCDCIGEMNFPSEKAFRQFYKKYHEKEIAAVLAEDENRFLEKGKVKVIVVGETWSSGPDGVTTIEKSGITQSDASDSDVSSSSGGSV